MGPQKQVIYYELLVLRCQREDKEALEEMIRLFERQILYYIRRLVENETDAWNILQETWIKVIRSIKQIREPKKLPAWLYSIARKTAISHLRAEYSKEAVFDCTRDIAGIQDNAEENLSFENAEQVHYGLSKISLPHREVLTLFFLQDLTLEQIADVLNISIGTVKSRLYYARQALKEVLAKEGNINE
ncbi:MAG TPA: sigma-70 family RNA polymerase sigma factor [Sedimentisphaerales bacterium]|nr:sigma-70 family RNA polymerase sigma factor [Sedimentisphaerales bacterium]